MSKVAILKAISIILAGGIVVSMVAIIKEVMNKNNFVIANERASEEANLSNKEINIALLSDEKIESYEAKNGKVYIKTISPQKSRLIIIDENKMYTKLVINLTYGEN